MSGTGPDDETDLLAGEYVLGVLDAAASAQVRLRAAAERGGLAISSMLLSLAVKP